MMRKLLHFVPLVLALLLAVSTVSAQEPNPAAVTTITVTHTGDDYADGKSVKCSDVPADECTLRRAINQAYALPDDSRPVAIEFHIPTDDPGCDALLGVCKIQLTGSALYDLRELYGQTTIDGTTQPDGRVDGPKIIVDGQDAHNIGLILRQNDNVLRGLAFQNFRDTHVSISSDNNLIEGCWFGLSDDGTTLSSGSDTEPELDSGVAWAAGADDNTVRNNVFAGFAGASAAIRGNRAVFSGNTIGTNASGLVPIPSQFDKHPCQHGAWTGGSGVTVDGDNHQIGGPTAAEGNLFAGLYLDVGPTTNQGPAIEVSGQGHVIQNNVIGLDLNGYAIGVCGRGISLLEGPANMLVLDNVIVEPDLSGIIANHWTFNGNTLQGNIVKREKPWPGVRPGQSDAEDAIAFAGKLPAELLSFEPAQVQRVDGRSVSGTAGKNSPCPNCTIELFLDDIDPVVETLESLARITADENGNWTATLPAPLPTGHGLRTMSTVPDSLVITGLHKGTTSRLSGLQPVVPTVSPTPATSSTSTSPSERPGLCGTALLPLIVGTVWLRQRKHTSRGPFDAN
jgi:hypothetical protein